MSAAFFEVFGVKPALGRMFAPDEDRQGKEKVVVLTHRWWMRQMWGDREVAGVPAERPA